MAAAELFTEFAATGADQVIRDAVKVQASIEKQARATNASIKSAEKAAEAVAKGTGSYLEYAQALGEVDAQLSKTDGAMKRAIITTENVAAGYKRQVIAVGRLGEEVKSASAEYGLHSINAKKVVKVSNDVAGSYVEQALALGKVEKEGRKVVASYLEQAQVLGKIEKAHRESAEAMKLVIKGDEKLAKQKGFEDLAKNIKKVDKEARDLAKTVKNGVRKEIAELGTQRVFPRLTAKIKDTKGMMSQLSAKFAGLGSIAKVAIAGAAVTAVAALAAGLAVAVKFVHTVVSELKAAWPAAAKFQKTMAIMKTTFADIGEESGNISFEGAIAQMEDLYKATLFTKEEILRVQAAVGRTSRDPEVFRKATQAALDLAAAKPEMSVPAASQWITTLLGDPARTMDKFRRAEIQVTKGFQKAMEQLIKEGKLVEAQLLTIDQLTQRFAGAAENVKLTDAGKLETLSKEWEDLMREGSMIFAEGFSKSAELAVKVLQDNKELFIDMFKAASVYTEKLAGFMQEIGAVSIAVLKAAQWYQNNTTPTEDDAKGTAMRKAVVGGAVGGVVDWLSLKPLRTAWEAQWNAVLYWTGQFEAKAANFQLSDKAPETDKQKEYAKQVKWAKQRTDGVEAEKKRLDEYTKKKKESDKLEKANQDEYLRSLKRVQVFVRDQATHWERYGEQVRKINDLKEKAETAGKGGRALDIYLDKIQRRLYGTAMEAQNKPAKDAAAKRLKEETSRRSQLNTTMEKFLKRDDKLRDLTTSFKEIMKGGGFDPAKQRASLMAISNLVGEIASPKKETAKEKGFQSSTVALSGLYEAMNSFVQKRDPVKDAIDKQTVQQQRLAKIRQNQMNALIARGPGPAIAGGTP